jgi:hypothetical protein
MSEINITWRQQHYNGGCASACVAMLLSGYSIDKRDDDIITEAKMPYRVAFDPADGGRFTAGIMMDTNEVFNSMLVQHRMMLSGTGTRNWAEFEESAAGLLGRGTPFMARVPTMAMPAQGYEVLRQRQQAGVRHHVVFRGVQDEKYAVLDPSGGLDRRREQPFDLVRDQVDLRVSKTVLRAAMELSGRETVLCFLDKWDGKQAEAILETLNRTRTALDALVKAADGLGANIAGSPAAKHEDILYDYLARCFKPIAMDWRTAIEAQRTKGKQQFDLIEQLYNLQDLIMKQQKELEAKPGIGIDFCAELSKTAQRIQQVAQGHLSSAYSIR